MRRSRDGTVRAAAAVVLLVATTHHLATAFSPSSSQRTSTLHSSKDIPRVCRFGSDSRHVSGRMAARSPRPDLTLNIKSPWRTVVDAEDKTSDSANVDGNSSPADSLLRIFDGTSNDNNGNNQSTKIKSSAITTKTRRAHWAFSNGMCLLWQWMMSGRFRSKLLNLLQHRLRHHGCK